MTIGHTVLAIPGVCGFRNEDVYRVTSDGAEILYTYLYEFLVGSDASNLRTDFLKILQRASLSKIRFHDLRHTAASLMLNNCVPPIVVSKILGHSKPSITLGVYGHLYVEMQSEAARIMDELVTPIPIDLGKMESFKVNSEEL